MIPALVTLGETMCVLQSEHIVPFRHKRSVRLGVVGAETNVAIGVRRLGCPAPGLVGSETTRWVSSSLASCVPRAWT